MSEEAAIAQLLSRLEPGLLPSPIFYELARLMVMPIVELVPLRLDSAGRVQVWLLARPADDPVWPGQLHVPGTVVRATDAPGSFADALGRIAEELNGAQFSAPVFVKNLLHHSGRGMEAAQVFWAEVQKEPATGSFYDAERLPDTLVQTQLDFIPVAVEQFKRTQG